MIQPAILIEQKAAGNKKSAPTFIASLLAGLFLLLTSGSGRGNLCRHWRSSVGWSLCSDDADADYVADFTVVLLVLTAALYWCRVSNWHIFPQLSLIIVALRRPLEELHYLLSQTDIYSSSDQKHSVIWHYPMFRHCTEHRPGTKLTKYTQTDHFVPSTLRHTQYGNQFWFSVFYVIWKEQRRKSYIS
jgi:hypothetical protein